MRSEVGSSDTVTGPAPHVNGNQTQMDRERYLPQTPAHLLYILYPLIISNAYWLHLHQFLHFHCFAYPFDRTLKFCNQSHTTCGWYSRSFARRPHFLFSIIIIVLMQTLYLL